MEDAAAAERRGVVSGGRGGAGPWRGTAHTRRAAGPLALPARHDGPRRAFARVAPEES